jgi:hypothetical protein
VIELLSAEVSSSEAVDRRSKPCSVVPATAVDKLAVVVMPAVLTIGMVMSVTNVDVISASFVEDSSIMVEVGSSVDDTSVDSSAGDEVDSSAIGDVEGSLVDEDPSVLVSIPIVDNDTDVVSSTSVGMVDSRRAIMVEAKTNGSRTLVPIVICSVLE